MRLNKPANDERGLWGNERGKPTSQKPPTAVVSAKLCIKRHLHTTHVGTVGWEPHRSSPTRYAGKTDHGFGACVPLALICPLKIVT